MCYKVDVSKLPEHTILFDEIIMFDEPVPDNHKVLREALQYCDAIVNYDSPDLILGLAVSPASNGYVFHVVLDTLSENLAYREHCSLGGTPKVFQPQKDELTGEHGCGIKACFICNAFGSKYKEGDAGLATFSMVSSEDMDDSWFTIDTLNPVDYMFDCPSIELADPDDTGISGDTDSDGSDGILTEEEIEALLAGMGLTKEMFHSDSTEDLQSDDTECPQPDDDSVTSEEEVLRAKVSLLSILITELALADKVDEALGNILDEYYKDMDSGIDMSEEDLLQIKVLEDILSGK